MTGSREVPRRSCPRQGMSSAATLRARRNWLAQAVHNESPPSCADYSPSTRRHRVPVSTASCYPLVCSNIRTACNFQPVNLLRPNPHCASKLAEKQSTLVIVRCGLRFTIWIRRRTTVSTCHGRGYSLVPMNSFCCVLRDLHQN